MNKRNDHDKILWFADLEHYRRTGHTITGATAYTKLPHGPVPKDIKRDFSSFTPDEIATIDMVAASISRLAHDALWDETEIGAEMSIGAASIQPSKPSTEDLEWARKAFAD